jgi:hypothetical protein
MITTILGLSDCAKAGAMFTTCIVIVTARDIFKNLAFFILRLLLSACSKFYQAYILKQTTNYETFVVLVGNLS